MRAVLDAVAYVVRCGIEWRALRALRALPVDFPPQEAVYAFLCRWNQRGFPEYLADQAHERIRLDRGRDPWPSAAVIDAQSL